MIGNQYDQAIADDRLCLRCRFSHHVHPIVLAVLFAWNVCGTAASNPLDASDNLAPNYVATMVLTQQTQSVVPRSFTGTLVAKRASGLGFKRIGRVESLSVDHGDRVVRGDVLARLDTAALQSQVAILRAERESAVALLDELIAGPRQQTLDAAGSRLRELQAMRDQLQNTFNRRQRLAGSDAISMQDIDDARHELAAAEARIMLQQHVVSELKEGTRKEKIAAQRAEVSRLDASLQAVAVEIQESSLIAPYDGFVSMRMVDEGAIVQPGVVVMKIIESAPYEAWVGVPPEICDGMELDQVYSLSVGGKEVSARLVAILPELDTETRTRTVILDCEQADKRDSISARTEIAKQVGAIGEIVQLNLSQTVEQTGYWLPVSALTRGVKGLWSLFVVVESEAGEFIVQRSDVEILQIDSSKVLVNGTIKSGDRVVTSGVQKLTEGQKVKLIEP
ncbi:efflux RND transporter periplasmic adaptor subunit [Stieleria varia]|nr:HlyD family efflux transporter periplasmic adaptor subunit [Stieleria varia]